MIIRVNGYSICRVKSRFSTRSQEQIKVTTGVREALAQNWLAMLQDLDLSAVANEDVLAKIAKSYTDYLHQCKSQGMQFIQPGRFVLPSDLEGAPALQFFPLIHLSEEQWKTLKKQPNRIAILSC